MDAFLTDQLVRRAGDVKGATATAYTTTVNGLTRCFGAGCRVRDVTEVRADDFQAHLQARGLASATAARRLRAARQFFKYAVRAKLIEANPFAGVTAVSVLPPERQHYVPRPTPPGGSGRPARCGGW